MPHIEATKNKIERAKEAEKFYIENGRTVPPSIALFANAREGEWVYVDEND